MSNTSDAPAVDFDRRALGAAFADARKRRGMTQRDLEKVTQIPQGKISRIERGVAQATIVELEGIVNAMKLNVKVQFLD